jgi:phosphate transport system permease protein
LTTPGHEIVVGEFVHAETLGVEQYTEATGREDYDPGRTDVERWLIKTGNRRVAPPDFEWRYTHHMGPVEYPPDMIVFERTEWGNAYGVLQSVLESGVLVPGADVWLEFRNRLQRVNSLREEIHALEQEDFNHINFALERLRLARRGIELDETLGDARRSARLAELAAEATLLDEDFQRAETRLRELIEKLGRDTIIIAISSGEHITLNLADIVRAWRPNAMSLTQKIRHYVSSLWLFLTEDPREANTEGGIFPAIFGTVMMVLLMSVLVTPLGVIAAVYLREYARQGPLVQLIRIAVNNLAGVPSIVYGVFGLGFFVYFIGGNLDQLFFEESLPRPTFGTPGLLWASLTLALLTVPVVVVSTEEGLTRIPRSLREGSLALGATKAETLFKVILPIASPSILTGVILAIARAAGEVAPLMLVGVVKLAPALPLDGNFPYLHLERKFMHLGFHIYDVGFQSPNVEAARPLVYSTALLLVLIIVILNLTAIMLRNRLEDRYRGVES